MQILLKPVVTEKMMKLIEDKNLNCYAFIVNKDANKLQIRKSVEEMYNVTVYSVNTLRYGGKTKSKYTRTGILSGKTKAFKKAIVTLVDGDTIDFYDNI